MHPVSLNQSPGPDNHGGDLKISNGVYKSADRLETLVTPPLQPTKGPLTEEVEGLLPFLRKTFTLQFLLGTVKVTQSLG